MENSTLNLIRTIMFCIVVGFLAGNISFVWIIIDLYSTTSVFSKTLSLVLFMIFIIFNTYFLKLLFSFKKKLNTIIEDFYSYKNEEDSVDYIKRYHK